MTQTNRISFKKRLPLAHVAEEQNDGVSATNDIAIDQVQNQSQAASDALHILMEPCGRIIETNAAFADILGLTPTDLHGRNIMDMVLFDKVEEISDDRALFNNLSKATSTSSHLKAGGHYLYLGPSQIRRYFQFDEVTGQNDQTYLVAGAVLRNDDTTSDFNLNHQWKDIFNQPSNTQDNIPNEEVDEAETINDFINDHVVADEVPSEAEAQNTIVQPQKSSFFSRAQKTGKLSANDIANFAHFSRNYLCVMGLDGKILRYNTALSHVIGDKKKSKLFLDFVDETERAATRYYLQSSIRNAEEQSSGLFGTQPAPMIFQTLMIGQNGDEPQWIEWTINIKKDLLYCSGHNITEAKNTEISLLRREQELSEAQALANMGHWRWTVGADNLEWSQQIFDIFGVNQHDFTPTLDNVYGLIHRRDIGHMMQAFQRAIIEQNDYDIDFRVMRGDGQTRYVRCEGRCDMDHDGDVIALYGVMQDITEQTAHEQELRAAKDSAEQAYASKSRFLANMSHELRTPLNAIIGFSDMLQREMLGALGNEKYKEYATSIHHSGEHLLSLITDILDMSKIEAGKYTLDLEKIQIGEVAKTAVRMIESRAMEGVITLDCQITDDNPVVIADRRAVMQIMLNVLSNAVKFTEPGGTITISLAHHNNHVTITVQDTGIGIPANKLSAVLKPFEQVSTAFTRNHEGSGLGLAITKELVELHGGTFTLESQEGEGTKALIRLPLDAGDKIKK